MRPGRAQTRPNIEHLATYHGRAGLFLAFIGLMGLLALTGFGLLIVFASLLLWTLGGRRSRLRCQLRKLSHRDVR